MDNDTKILSIDAINILLEVLENNHKVSATGAYGIVLRDRARMKAYVGREFSESIFLSGVSCYFAVHRTKAYLEVGGMPRKWLYNMDDKFNEGIGFNGDFTIGENYYSNGWSIKSPPVTLPVLHWGRTTNWFNKKEIENWWYENVKHERVTPLNNWINIDKEYLKTWGKYNNYGWKYNI
jgi:hypothetical protein